jgi:hypothetical protein
MYKIKDKEVKGESKRKVGCVQKASLENEFGFPIKAES